MGLSDLPSELLNLIGEFVPSADLPSLYKSNKRHYQIFVRHIYRRDALSDCLALPWAIKERLYNTAQKSIEGLKESGMMNTRGQALLLLAAEKGHEAIVDLFLKAGADTEARTRYGQTPLLLAARQGHLAIVKQLLDARANVNARDNILWAPLHEAARQGHETIVKGLLDAGADVKVQDSLGSTPLILAIFNGHEAIVKLLEAKE